MKRSPDNQINASFIEILRIKWLAFCYSHLSSAQLDRWQAPKQRPIIDRHPVGRWLILQTAFTTEIKDNGYKSVFTNSWLVCQRNRSWILKGSGKNPQKSELIHWWQCLLSGATEPCPLGLRETLACIHVIPHNVTPCVLCWRGSRPNTQTNRKKWMRVKTLVIRPSQQKFAGLYGIRCELVKATVQFWWISIEHKGLEFHSWWGKATFSE